MEIRVTTKEEEGPSRTYVGMEVCTGPRTFRLVLTWPYERGGRVVEIPLRKIDSVAQVEPRAMGEVPTARQVL